MDKRIHPQLDPRKFDATISGFDGADYDPAFTKARRARQGLADALGRVHDAAEALSRDGTRTPMEQSRLLHDTAKSVERRAIDQGIEGERALRDRVRRADREIDAALRTSAPPEASEIRAYVKSLDTVGKRLDFLRSAVRDGDVSTAAAILTAKPYLSGLDQKGAATIRSEAERQILPDEAKARDAAARAADEMGEATQRFYRELQKVDDPAQAAKAVEQRQRSEAAMRSATGLEPVADGAGDDPEPTDDNGHGDDDNADAA